MWRFLFDGGYEGRMRRARRTTSGGVPTGAGALLPTAWLAAGVALLICPRSLPAEPPRRIVSLAPSATESLFALGLGDRVIGVSTYCDYPAEVNRIERVGTFLTPNIERIVARKPDVIVAVPSPGNRAPVETLRRLGLRVVVVNPDSVAQIEEALRLLGKELDRAEAAERAIGGMREKIASVRRHVSGRAPRRVLMVVGHTPLVAAGRGTYADELIGLAGGVNVAAAAGRGWPQLSVEFPLAAAPEVIVDTSMGNEAMAGDAAAFEFWSRFPGIPAVRDRRVHGAGAHALLHAGPRIGEALEALARFIHPEAFE